MEEDVQTDSRVKLLIYLAVIISLSGCGLSYNERNHVKTWNQYRYQVIDSRSHFFYTDAISYVSGCISFDGDQGHTIVCGNYTITDRSGK